MKMPRLAALFNKISKLPSTDYSCSNDSGTFTVSIITALPVENGAKLKDLCFKMEVRMTLADVSSEAKSWHVYQRSRDISHFLETLKDKMPSLDFKVPDAKVFCSLNFDRTSVKARKKTYMDILPKVINNNEVTGSKEFQDFFSVNSNFFDSTPAKEKVSPSPSSDCLFNEEPPLSPINLGPSERKTMKPKDFEFLRVVGKGSFGKVYLARHTTEDHIYAVKVLEKIVIIKRNEAKHIMAERNVLLKNLNHPFLVGLHYSFQTKDKLYFVLDYVNGGELFFHLQRERTFEESRAKLYAAEITSALGYLHSVDVVYRDLKPENILLDKSGHVILTDFGLCKDGLTDDQTTATFCGTPEYLAPEILRKQPYDRAVDWWCLGAVLYEMLYGLPPFYSRDTNTLYDNILNQPLRLRPSVSENGRDLLSQLLEKQPILRLGSGPRDWEEIKNHSFFANLNWDDLVQRRIPAPFKPEARDEFDLRNIDPEFTRERVSSSVGRSAPMDILPSYRDNVFAGFSYIPSPVLAT